MKVRTPEELAQVEAGKGPVTLYLDKGLMKDLAVQAKKHDVSVSKLVNEAIYSYLQAIKK
jgi:predicted HicB family RNase H-like nuclease